MAITTYNPLAANALFNAFTGVSFDDPKAYISVNGKRIDAKYFLVPMQNEVLKLISLAGQHGMCYPAGNNTGSTLPAGPVRINTTNGTTVSGGWTLYFVTAASAAGNAPADGLLLTSVANGGSGFACQGGTFTSTIDTTTANIGDPVYLAVGGGVTLTPPSGADQIVQIVGRVKTKANPGQIDGYIAMPTKIGSSWLQIPLDQSSSTASAQPAAYLTSSAGEKVIFFRNAGNAFDSSCGIGLAANLWFKASGNTSTQGVIEFWTGSTPTRRGYFDSNGLSLPAMSTAGLITNNGSGTLLSTTMTDGQLVVGKTGSAPQFVTASGDISAISNAGAFTIAAGAVSTSKMDTTNNGGAVHQWENILENPQGRVAQRAPLGISGGTGIFYGQCDRWKAGLTAGSAIGTGGNFVQDTSTSVGNSGYSMKFPVPTVTTGTFTIRQYIEKIDAAKLLNRTAIFSVIVRHDVGSNINFVLNMYPMTADDNGTLGSALVGGNLGSNQAVVTATPTTINSGGISISTNASHGFVVEIQASVGTLGSAKNIWITDAQLQLGSTVTPCEERDYADELVRCQRSYCVHGYGDGANTALGCGYVITTTTANVMVQHPVVMRKVPTMLTSAGAASDYFLETSSAGANLDASLSAVPAIINAAWQSREASGLRISTSTVMPTGTGCILIGQTTTAQLRYDADF